MEILLWTLGVKLTIIGILWDIMRKFLGYIFPVNIETQPSSTIMKTMMKHEETIQKSCLVDIIWVNYNDLTATSLESWLVRGIIPKWPYFRLVKYYNLQYPDIIGDMLWNILGYQYYWRASGSEFVLKSYEYVHGSFEWGSCDNIVSTSRYPRFRKTMTNPCTVS